MNWFTVDKAGLAAILERRGKVFALYELNQNAWDAKPSQVHISLTPIAGQPYARLVVTDDGEGFYDLSHTHTMFARSSRAGDPTKRGRFNLGEKLVLAVCRKASVITTSGAIDFKEDGTVRWRFENRRGTSFDAEIRMTRDELTDSIRALRRLIPPVPTFFRGEPIEAPTLLRTFEAKLPTELADDEGQLRRTVRTATVQVFESEGEILELGIPVCETDNGFRLNVLQKVPLNMERDNVTSGFLKAIQAALLNNVHDMLDAETAAAPWVQEAAGDARAQPEAVKSVVVRRFGEHAVVATPNDPVANANAAAAGFTVIPGGALSADAWANVRKHGLLKPAGQVFPTPRPEQLAAALVNEATAPICPTCGRPK